MRLALVRRQELDEFGDLVKELPVHLGKIDMGSMGGAGDSISLYGPKFGFVCEGHMRIGTVRTYVEDGTWDISVEVYRRRGHSKNTVRERWFIRFLHDGEESS